MGRRCLQFGLMGCKPRKKSLMTNVQRRKRIQWAWQCASWSCWMWKQVLISDESTFCLFVMFENQANTYVRRFPGEVFKPEFLNLTVKHPLKIMVCGCISASGVGRLHIVNGMVNETKYIAYCRNAWCHQHSSSFMNSSCFRMTMRHVIVLSWSPNGSPRRTSGH